MAAEMNQPFLSIVTRCHPHRPTYLARNIASVEGQTDTDYEHIFVEDQEGRGLAWANFAIQAAYPGGEYVLILDDDDMLTDDEAIAKLRQAAADNPDVVVFKADHARLGILPMPSVWGRKPIQGRIGSCDFIVSQTIWERYIHYFNQPRCGDYHFLEAIWESEPEVVWLDEQLAAVQRISGGAPE